MAVQYGPLFRFVEAGQRSSGIAPVAAPPRDRRSTNQEMDGTAGLVGQRPAQEQSMWRGDNSGH